MVVVMVEAGHNFTMQLSLVLVPTTTITTNQG